MNVADPGKSAINSEHHVISYCLKMAVEGDKLMQKTCKWPKNWNNNFKTAESLSVSASTALAGCRSGFAKNEWGSTALIQIMQHFTFVCGIVTEMAAWIAISKSQLTMRGLPPGNVKMR